MNNHTRSQEAQKRRDEKYFRVHISPDTFFDKQLKELISLETGRVNIMDLHFYVEQGEVLSNQRDGTLDNI